MNADQFVSALVEHVHEAAIADVVAQLEAPAGRQPPTRSVELSAWYAKLSEQDRRNLVSVIGHSVHAALFGTLCAIDGVRCIHEGAATHEFQLFSTEQGAATRLNEPDAQALHDVYQGLVYQRVFG
jgi:hypothetical protein